MKISTALATLLALLVSFSFDGFAAGEIPSTTGSISTAGPEMSTSVNRPALMVGSDFAGANIRVYPVRAPEQGTEWSRTVSKVMIDDIRGGTLENGGQYELCRGKIYWQDLILGKTGGNSTNKWVLQQVIRISSTDGSDSISLHDLVVKAISTGGLSDIYDIGVLLLGYSDAAYGIRRDGRFVNSGPGDEKVAEIFLVVQMKLFIGGETPAGLNAVEAFVMSYSNFMIVYEVTLRGDTTSSIGKAQVSIQGFDGVRPRLSFANRQITLVAGDLGRIYDFQESSNPSGPWSTTGTLQVGGNPIRIADMVTLPWRFYRVVGH